MKVEAASATSVLIISTYSWGQAEGLHADDAVSLQMRALRERMKELQSNHDAKVSLVLGKYQALRQQVSEYHDQLTAATNQAQHEDADTNALSSAVKAISLR